MPVATAQLGLSNHAPVSSKHATAIHRIHSALNLLLVDKDVNSLACHRVMLSNTGYCVITATTLREIFGLGRIKIQLAVLSDSLGSSILRGAAENIRRTWPSARIIVLGAAHSVLPDQLYDEEVKARITTEDLLVVLGRLLGYSINHHERYMEFGGNLADFMPWSGTERLPALKESDPSKEADYESVPREEPRDLPAEERKSSRVADPQSAWLAHTVHAAALSTVRD